MDYICLDDLINASNLFRKKLKQFEDYIKHLETNVPAHKRTMREQTLVDTYGKKHKIKPKKQTP